MKLYTKEMFLIAAEKCEVSMIDAKHIMQYIDEYVTPIELPSYDDIEKVIEQEYKKHHNNKYLYDHSDELKLAYKAGCWDGIKWMKEQIINQTK